MVEQIKLLKKCAIVPAAPLPGHAPNYAPAARRV